MDMFRSTPQEGRCHQRVLRGEEQTDAAADGDVCPAEGARVTAQFPGGSGCQRGGGHCAGSHGGGFKTHQFPAGKSNSMSMVDIEWTG